VDKGLIVIRSAFRREWRHHRQEAASNDEDHYCDSHQKYEVFHYFWDASAALVMYEPKLKIEGTHSPTKIPASSLPGPNTPNQSAIEKRKDKNAAAKIK
jgi:hypothetical protein